MRETTTCKTIEQLRRLFSSYGLPEELVSDNGPQFTGSEMKGFLEGNGIKQTLIPAYHPQSNGLAERAVRTIKTALDKNKRKIGDTIQDTLSKVLLAYRSTPHVTTGKTPSELFIGRVLRTRVSLIHPSLASRVRDQQARQMKYDRRAHLEEFQIDDLVWCKNFRGGDKWIPGKIVGKKGTRVYTILIHGQVKAYHRDQIRKRWRNGEEDESGDGERQPEHSRGAGPSAIISEVVRDRGYMESLSPGLTSQRSDQDSEVQSDADDGKSLEPLCSLDPEALKEEGPVLRRNPPRARRPPPVQKRENFSCQWFLGVCVLVGVLALIHELVKVARQHLVSPPLPTCPSSTDSLKSERSLLVMAGPQTWHRQAMAARDDWLPAQHVTSLPPAPLPRRVNEISRLTAGAAPSRTRDDFDGAGRSQLDSCAGAE
ncbi:K02A2.6-like [Cordylochernes scorpioides]|uniref:K02A2.6-like n=1 Tax=Cordylochernes scorpioides TaxID=51811 RepID=A0ABY6KVN0_9ARAC|nr:K02A2.6-like [Cordylochernes scorpioides]